MNIVISEEVASRIYDILVDDCGASKSMREHWLYHQTNPNEHTHEWRFGGKLGFGGKFWRCNGNWYVNGYPEDYTPEMEQLIEETNKKLVKLRMELGIEPGQQ